MSTAAVLFDNKIKTRPIDLGSPRKGNVEELPAQDILATAPLVKQRIRKPRFEPIAILLEAAERGDLEEVRHVLAHNRVSPNACSEKTGLTALHYAVANGHVPVVRLLLDYGARINVVDAKGWTPLMMAAANDDRRMAALLLQNSADIEIIVQAQLKIEDRLEEREMTVREFAGPNCLPLIERCWQSKYHGAEVVALYDFDPRRDAPHPVGDELSLKEGDLLWVLHRRDDDWWLVENSYGHQGLIPRTHVQ